MEDVACADNDIYFISNSMSMNIPHFSQNFEYEPQKHAFKKQLLFVDARDYITPDNNGSNELSFTVVLSDYESKASLNIPSYEQVTQVELKAVCLPKIADEMYYVIDIPEFSGRLHSSDNTGSHESFCMVYYPNHSIAVGSATPAKGSDFDQKLHVITPPIKSLSKFSIKFKKHGGEVLTVSDIAASTDYDAAIKKVNLLFEFTIKQ